MADNLLHKWFPTTQLPLIISAPMFTVANGAMAAAVGSVAAARAVVRCGVDVVVAQGCDAGGHQWADAAGVVTLVPEIVDALRGKEGVAVVAGGGIVDGRGVAAALALGAQGVTMGTRFVACDEADSNKFVRKAILNASDGGASTTRSCMNDAIMGYPTWSELYAGRVIRHAGLQDLANGVPLQEVHESFKKAVAEDDETRMVTFAQVAPLIMTNSPSGTGVGLVHESQPAGEIVREVRSEALAVIDKLKAQLTVPRRGGCGSASLPPKISTPHNSKLRGDPNNRMTGLGGIVARKG
ncbi:2-nitropropane dioxygenase [Pyricularia oryzae Y34]|uniref:2-nitropropane dioxygenase n=1 Tax=Pyricularia oryzae (strain Y34) TaxID=1143189 RepID=A0AA97NU31_PYRO3|nr:2-nitropropane dioxygenase [Pyricularia oryzae Y34]